MTIGHTSSEPVNMKRLEPWKQSPVVRSHVLSCAQRMAEILVGGGGFKGKYYALRRIIGCADMPLRADMLLLPLYREGRSDRHGTRLNIWNNI